MSVGVLKSASGNRSGIGICLGLILLIGGCASLERHPNFSLGAIWPNTKVRSSAPVASTSADYLKARYSARQQSLDDAAEAYGSVSKDKPEDFILLQRAFFYALASGQKKRATDLAIEIDDRKNANSRLVVKRSLETPGTMNSVSATGLSDLNSALPEFVLYADRMQRGKAKEAQSILENVEGSMFSRSIAHMLNAWAVYETSEPTDAVNTLRTPRSNDIFGGFISLHQALMMDGAAPEQMTGEAYQDALGGFAQQVAVQAYASWLERSGKTDQAVRLYRAMVADGGVVSRAGRIGLARLGQPIAGETRSILTLAKKNPEPMVSTGREGAALVFYNFAWSAYEQAISEYEAASRAGFDGFRTFLNTPLAYAQVALMLDPGLDEANYLIGAIYMDYDKYEAAARAFEEVGLRSVYYQYAVMEHARALYQMDKKQAALKLLGSLVTEDPYALDANLLLATYYAEEYQHDKSDALLTSGLEAARRFLVNPEEPQTSGALWRWYFTRGVGRIENDQWEEGEADLMEAQRLAPEEPLVLNYLGYSWVERAENLDEAFAMLEKALALHPESGAITDSLGWAYYQRENYEQAVFYLEKAVRLEPSDPVITAHLGDAYSALGRHREAMFEWRRALDYEPEDALRAELEAKLTSMATVMAETRQY